MRKLFLLFSIVLSSILVAQDYALKQLENSPRHHEWIEIDNNGKTIYCFLVYPESGEPTDVVIAIHENRGLNDWARSFADQLAAKGFLVIAPDLLSSYSSEYDQTSDFESSDEARKAIYTLDADQITSDLDAVYEYASKLSAATTNISVVGFCWGGSQSFRYATNNPKLKMAGVFYGTAPADKTELQSIECPVYGFYGGNDERVNATIPETEESMFIYGKKFESEVYEGAGHAFMRRGDDPEGDVPNINARNQAWDRLVLLLKQPRE